MFRKKDSKKMVEQIGAIALFTGVTLVSYGSGYVVSLSLGIALGGYTCLFRS